MSVLLHRVRRFAAPACAMLLAACTAVPEGFVPVPSQRGRDVEALSAEGAIFALTRHDSPSEATLEFWVDATKVELVERRGYEILAEGPVSGNGGMDGHELWMKTPTSLGDQRYLVALFLQPRFIGTNYIHVAEAAGPAQLVEPRLEAIRQAIASNF